MALAVESATGMVIGMNVPDSHLPLCKSMHVDFVKLCKGNITAEATLSEEDRKRITTEEKGSLFVECTVVDSEGKAPIKAAMEWAWVPKNREKTQDKTAEKTTTK